MFTGSHLSHLCVGSAERRPFMMPVGEGGSGAVWTAHLQVKSATFTTSQS